MYLWGFVNKGVFQASLARIRELKCVIKDAIRSIDVIKLQRAVAVFINEVKGVSLLTEITLRNKLAQNKNIYFILLGVCFNILASLVLKQQPIVKGPVYIKLIDN